MATYPYALAPIHIIAADTEAFPVDGDMGHRVHADRRSRSDLWSGPRVYATAGPANQARYRAMRNAGMLPVKVA